MSRARDRSDLEGATQPREAHIPLRPAELACQLGDDPAVTIFEREQFRQLCQLIEATIHHEFRERLESLKAAYAPFNPDDDTAVSHAPKAAIHEDTRHSRCRQLFAEFNALLERANYRRLPREVIEKALKSPLHTGLRLHLDLNLFEHLEIYVRGDCQLPEPAATGWQQQLASALGISRRRHGPRDGPIANVGARSAPATVPGYRRLAIIFRLQRRSRFTDPLDTRAVSLKLFKDIPQQDIEALLPGGSIRIGLFEQAQIVVPTLSGLSLTLFKLLKGATAVAFAGIYGLIAFLGLVAGAIGYGARSFFSYVQTREKHHLCLTRHLYFQNLDNNAGVIYHLLNEAEEQELREVVLAWWLLWRGGLAGATAVQIDRAAEAWLRERCGLDVDFEVSDALAKLRRYGLARESAGGRWRAVSIEDALAALDAAWDRQFDYQRLITSQDIQPRAWRAAA